MIKTVILSLSLCLTAVHVTAQALIPFEFVSEEENRFIKENDSCKFYAAVGDSNIVCLNEEGSYYKLLDRSQRVIAEGSYIAEGDKYLQTGKWVERYDNGRVKNTGYYLRNKPTGTWEEFYSNGKLKTVANYTIVLTEKGTTSFCLTGSWQEFYANGKLKVSGHYSAAEAKVKDTLTVEDPITEQKILKVSTKTQYSSVKAGTWEYYTENGALDRKEEL